jgi:hypothetical protein
MSIENLGDDVGGVKFPLVPPWAVGVEKGSSRTPRTNSDAYRWYQVPYALTKLPSRQTILAIHAHKHENHASIASVRRWYDTFPIGKRMGLPLRMDNIHAPTVPAGATSRPLANGNGANLSFAELQHKKSNMEAELSALGGVLDSVLIPHPMLVFLRRRARADWLQARR